ncbi:MAG: hypothetical protein ACOYB8_07045 [Eubacteriaceae bacterium]|jgi:hypothetical protein
MTKEEREFIRWIIENAQTESELFRAADAAEAVQNSHSRIITTTREEKPYRKMVI